MRYPLIAVSLLTGVVLWATTPKSEEIVLFNGSSLAGWKASEEGSAAFRVQAGMLQVRGGRGHLFYVGPDGAASFQNFEFTAQVRTRTHANSGIYFHTRYQPSGWPSAGYEAQVNATHEDRKRTGGLYGIVDVLDKPAAGDDQWFDYRIRVEGKRIRLWVNGEPTVDFTEPEGWQPPNGMAGRRLGTGTFALQAHDPGCTVDYRDLRVRRLH